ncbi:hypothetical protein K470DRAFT_254301 [Piedraia hortae CBS 480.64]|uniref:Uncharacterized protein n=1 Tax=Piedraia hortae CBS 480.64 TaxID=1314780 RepID=A0A6A7C8T6_9PEZI|nr:hypothetical protein K470DRAFT_254301 [Piedraia hortae CBS 480.64]
MNEYDAWEKKKQPRTPGNHGVCRSVRSGPLRFGPHRIQGPDPDTHAFCTQLRY